MLSFSNDQIDAIVVTSAQAFATATWAAIASVTVAALANQRTDKAFQNRMEKAFAKAKVSDDYAARIIRMGKHEKTQEAAKAAIKRNGSLEDNVAAVAAKLKAKFKTIAALRAEMTSGRKPVEPAAPKATREEMEAEIASLKGKLSQVEEKASAVKVPGKAATAATAAKALAAWVEAGQVRDILGHLDPKALNSLAIALQSALVNAPVERKVG